MRTSVDMSTARWYARALDGVLAPDQTSPERREESATEAPPISLEDVTSPRAQDNLARLADRLGTEPATLLAKIASGEDVRALLAGTSDSGYGVSTAPPSIGGIAFDQYA
jgi:hypothetical protein